MWLSVNIINHIQYDNFKEISLHWCDCMLVFTVHSIPSVEKNAIICYYSMVVWENQVGATRHIETRIGL